MLTEICAELHNYFCRDEDKHFGEFTVSGGNIAPLDFLENNQWFRVVGSVFNDGVYLNGDTSTTFKDETFDGAIWAMRVPTDVIDLANDIEEFQKSDAGKPTVFTSESFGGYSYSKATDGHGRPATWKDLFRSRLNRYRRVRP